MKHISILTSVIFLMLPALYGCKMPDTAIEEHIETVGSELTGTSVTVDDIKIRPARGIGVIDHLRVSNPEGYVAKNAVSIGLLRLNLGLLSTVAGDPVVIDDLTLSYPVVNLEKKADGGSNLRQLYEQIQERRDKADQKSSEMNSDKPIRMKVKELKIEGVTLNVLTASGESRSAILPTVILEDVGGEDGISPALLGLTVAGAMTGEMLKQAIAHQIIERAGDIKHALSTENLMALIDYKLHLTPEMEELVRPVVARFSEALTATIDGWVDQGHIDLAELEEQFMPIFEDFRERLEEVLDSERFAAIKEQLPDIKDNAVEVLRYLIIARIGEYLNMTPEQIIELKPVLHEYMIAVSGLISDFAADPEKNKDMFMKAYEEIDKRVHERLAEALTEEQLEKFSSWRAELAERLNQLVEQYR